MDANGPDFTLLNSKPANNMTYDGKAQVARPSAEKIPPAMLSYADPRQQLQALTSGRLPCIVSNFSPTGISRRNIWVAIYDIIDRRLGRNFRPIRRCNFVVKHQRRQPLPTLALWCRHRLKSKYNRPATGPAHVISTR